MKNKKAMEFDTLKVLIIALLLSICILWIVSVLRSQALNFGSIEACRLNVVSTHESIHSKMAFLEKTIPLSECQTKDVGELEVEIDSDDGNLRKRDIMRKIAKLHDECWYQFVEGKKDPWPGYWTDEKAGCFVCSIFGIPEDIDISNHNYTKFLKEYQSEKPSNAFDLTKAGMLNNNGDYYYFISGLDLSGEWNIFTDVTYNQISFDIDQMNREFNPVYSSGVFDNRYGVVYWHLSKNIFSQTLGNVTGGFTFSVITPLSQVKDLGCEFIRVKIDK